MMKIFGAGQHELQRSSKEGKRGKGNRGPPTSSL